jgi:hypothetical protein
MTSLALFIVLLAIWSEAPYLETLMVRVLAVVACVSTLGLWLRWHEAAYAWAVLFLAVAIGVFFGQDYSRSSVSWTARLLRGFYFVFMAFLFWQSARRLSAVQDETWDRERDQVGEWASRLRNPTGMEQVLEFSSGNFWKGYFIHRIINTGHGWVVARFKKGNTRRIIECRVLNSSAIHITELPRQELSVEIDGKPISKIGASPDMRNRLLTALSAK